MTPSDWYTSLREKTQRQHLRVLAFVVFFASITVLLWWSTTLQTPVTQPVVLIPPDPSLYATATPPQIENAEEAPLTAPRSKPMTIRIPSLDLVAPFEGSMYLDDEGAIEVPVQYDTVGWYGYGPMPGELGPAVVLGHVDSHEGPGVFYSLGSLKKGDTVEIEREDGSVAVFSVTGLERVEQGAFPNDRVYGNIPFAGLRLITCSGTYDRGVRRYSHNLIVYAELIAVENAATEPSSEEPLPPVEMSPVDTLQ